MSTSCWAVINDCHWLWKIALFLLVTSAITVSYWTCSSIAHPYTECRGEWFPIVIIASIKIMTIIEWDNIHDNHHSPPLYKLYNLSIWRHSLPHILDISHMMLLTCLTWHPEPRSACSPSPLVTQSPVMEGELLVTDIIRWWWMCSSETGYLLSCFISGCKYISHLTHEYW